MKANIAKSNSMLSTLSDSFNSVLKPVLDNNDNTKALVAITALGLYAFLPSLVSKLSSRKSMYKLPSLVYNAMVVNMTERWYKVVLEQMEEGECFLDVGIGTAGALVRCADIIKSKNIKVVGLDYNALYIEEARIAVHQAGLDDHVSLVCMSIYDEKELPVLVSLLSGLPGSKAVIRKVGEEQDKKQYFDSIYFSGSFSLLPSPIDALHSVSTLLPPSTDGGGKIYITQTYQRYTPPFLQFVKPLIKYVTTIDFGQLITTSQILEIYDKSGIKLVEHEVIEDSIDTFLQAAYLSVLTTSKQ